MMQANLHYEFIGRTVELYNALEDELSKKIFCARLQCDITNSVDDALNLFALTGMLTPQEHTEQMKWRETFSKLQDENKKIILYGAGACGHFIAYLLLNSGSDFYGFCDQRWETLGTIFGKPVLPPDYLLEHPDECYVLILSMDYGKEILDFLQKNHFPQRSILPYFNKLGTSFAGLIEKQYFDFPDFYVPNTAFIDGGCYNCGSSIRFAEWCGGVYSKIIAFEPDLENYQRCKAVLKSHPVPRMELINAGLSDVSGTASFAASNDAGSHLVVAELETSGLIDANRYDEQIQRINVTALDDVVKENCRVGFIKLDIEGAELSALQGAMHTLLRDKPFLAICVYHRKGDVLAIMDYLKRVIPEYRFWLRQYSSVGVDTVLYAAV